MKICQQCNTQNADGAQFCEKCGASLADAPVQAAPDTATSTEPVDPEAESGKAMSILAYLGILVLIPIFAEKKNTFVRYHSNQGLVLFLFEIGYWVIWSILTTLLINALFSYSTMGMYTLLSTLLSLLSIFFIVEAIIGIINAAGGKKKPLPLIGSIKILK